jgi:hypothetical protein
MTLVEHGLCERLAPALQDVGGQGLAGLKA